jgi:hypothetical protein
MCNQHRFPTSLLHLSAIVAAAVALTVFLCPPQSVAQITVGSVTSVPDATSQTVSGTCANYNTALHSTGVLANGRKHPDHCRSTAITPLFDGIPLGTNMQAFFDSPNHPPLFTVQITHGKGQYCAANSRLKVTLSASLQATGLQWTGNTFEGSRCTSEVTRVNGVSTPPVPPAPPSPVISPTVQAKMTTLLGGIANELARVPQMSGCGPTAADATKGLDQQVWTLLQNGATVEVTRFQASVAPAIDTTNSCAAKCNLCFTGWVGIIQCTADANGTVAVAAGAGTTTYLWHEAQTWDVGGISASGTGGPTDYPANFTSSGGGSAITTVRGQVTSTQSWTVNATKMETLTDHGVNTSKRFTTTNNMVPGGIIWNGSTVTSADQELQFMFNADQVGGNTANSNSPTADPTPTIPTCNPTQKPGGIPCTVACTWDLVMQ